MSQRLGLGGLEGTQSPMIDLHRLGGTEGTEVDQDGRVSIEIVGSED